MDVLALEDEVEFLHWLAKSSGDSSLIEQAHGALTRLATVDLEKVGPKGYIHGWIHVGAPGVGDVVDHPEFGSGRVVRAGRRTNTVQFADGERRAFEHGGMGAEGVHFAERLRKPRAPRTAPATATTVPPGVPEVSRATLIPEDPHGVARMLVNAQTREEAGRIAADLNGRRLTAVADALGVRHGGSAKDRREAIVEHAIGYALYSAPSGKENREAFLADHRARRLAEIDPKPKTRPAKPEPARDLDTRRADTLTAEVAHADEPVRARGDGALAQVPAGRVQRDSRPDDVLPRAGGADREPNPRSGGRVGTGDPERSSGRAADDQASGDPAGRGTGRAGGDAAESGGRRDGPVGPPPVFHPTGQDDLAPATEKQRLAANLVALDTLRTIQHEGRPATAEEQSKLARWSSWGALSNVFREPPPDKAYANAQERLKNLLSPAEYSAARRTVRNAHYTDAGYVAAVWDAMGQLGFHGGEVLEPGSGSGTFMGLAPDGAHVTGVELDPVTAAISHALYPNHDVRTESFADTRVPDGAFDAVVGNVPFANTKLVDATYNPGRALNMHNHFIVKSLRMTRPGGTVALLTSRYTMDSRSPEARHQMAELGDLVGAVRLPSGAHRKAAGTEVVTDLLVFRRREPGTPYAGLPFENARSVQVDGKDVAVNEHFVDNPRMVLGTLGAESGMHGENDLVVRGDRNAEPALREALGRVVADAKAKGLTQSEGRSPSPLFHATGVDSKPAGYLEANADGTFTRMAGGVPQPHKVPSTQADELRQLLHLRDTALALVDAEAANGENTDDMRRLREDLNRSYDAYVANPNYGPVSRFTETRTGGGGADDVEEETVTRRRPPQGGFRNDPFSSVVRGLEDYDPVTGQARKTDIFYKRTIAPRAPRDSADNPADALALSLDQSGKVDLEHIADLLGTDEDSARRALGPLVFDEPGSGRLVPAAEYLSGNVREKLDTARLLAADDPERYGPNVEALQRAMPPDLTPAEIRAKMGAGWIDPKYVQQFLRETLRDPSLTAQRKHGTDWEVKSANKNSLAATTEWGIRERSAVDLAEDILSQRPTRVTIDGKVHQNKTEAAMAKAQELSERFEQWAWEDPTRSSDLQHTYNTRFNSLVLRSYPGDEMELPGLARDGFLAYPHRFAAIRRIVNEPSVGLWHEVGAGKTSVMIASAMEMRRLGLVNKPAIVVPNHMLEQMTREFLERYPQARVLAIGADELKNDADGSKRRDIIARAATGNWDAVILTQGAFKRIPVSGNTERDYLQSEVDPLRRSVERQVALVEQKVRAELAGHPESEIVAEVNKAIGKDNNVKELEGLVQAAEERVKEHMTSVARDPGLTFERTGIDYLFMDEAQTYKNLRTASRVQGMGIPGAQIATDLHMKLHYLRSKSDRVATLATATPIANSVSESYTMMRYLRPDLLRDMGIETFDEFAANFGQIVTRMEVSPTGGLRQHSRFAKFINLPELLKPWLVMSDVKTAEDLKGIVKTPDLVERIDADGHRIRTPETVVVPPSEALKAKVAELVIRAKNIPYPPEKGGDNMLRITGEGRAAALDMRMVGRNTSEPQKLDIAADRIASIYGEHKDHVYTDKAGQPHGQPGALQLVFSDIGTPTTGKPKKAKTDDVLSAEDEGNAALAKFSAYEALRDKLVARGIPKSRIAFIHDAKTDQDKAELFAAARDGRIAVLIGSTQKMGVGTNVQDRAVALHHLDAPWRPADVQQREGRIIRQGNKNKEVQVIRYVTEQSFDSYIWQAIATKAEFINQIMRGRADVREMDDVGDFALSAAEVTALGTGSRHLIEHSDAHADLTRLQRALRNHEADQRNISGQINNAQSSLAAAERAVGQIEQAIPKRRGLFGDNFRMQLGGHEHTDRAVALEQLRTAARRARRDALGEDTVIGEFSGFPLKVSGGEFGSTHIELDGVPGSRVTLSRTEIDDADLISKLTGKLVNLEKTRNQLVAGRERARQDIASLRGRVGAPFRDAAALQAARERFERVDGKLREELAARGQTLEPADPAAAAVARHAAEHAALRQRLDDGGGFSGIGEVTEWAEADPELAKEIPDDAGAKWGTLSPGGHLVVQRGTSGWQITIPRTMRTARSLDGFKTKKDALAFATALEGTGVPWNTEDGLKTWHRADGAGAAEIIARLRGEHDPKGGWTDAADQAEVRRRTPKRLREALLSGSYRRDGLGAGAFVRVNREDRLTILGMLADDNPDHDLATAARLREYGLAGNRSYDAVRVALGAADRLEQDYRAQHPQPLDRIRERLQPQMERIQRDSDRARINQILAAADASGDLALAVSQLRALIVEIRENNRYGYGINASIDAAGEFANLLERRVAVLEQQAAAV